MLSMSIFNLDRHSTATDTAECPLCKSSVGKYRDVDGVGYFECAGCDFIFADPAFLARIDAGENVRKYDETYWENELSSARQRSFGSSLARSAEALLYCRIPVERFIDIGSGPGFLLDALSTYLPSHSARFYGVEKFPPNESERSRHENYLCSDLADVGMQFECGVCIEVIEHLTPTMAASLAIAMASVSKPGSLFLFNTGLTDYVKHEDPGYLDPYARGHITSWSERAARHVFEKAGFVVHPLPGKTWAFVVEMPSRETELRGQFRDRIWSALPANTDLLSDRIMGNVMYILGLESARAY
jgi:ribosomal protein L37AE/L43A